MTSDWIIQQKVPSVMEHNQYVLVTDLIDSSVTAFINESWEDSGLVRLYQNLKIFYNCNLFYQPKIIFNKSIPKNSISSYVNISVNKQFQNMKYHIF